MLAPSRIDTINKYSLNFCKLLQIFTKFLLKFKEIVMHENFNEC